MRWWPSIRLPLRFLRGHYGRLFLTVIALAFGVALVCAIDLVNRAVFVAFAEVVDSIAGRAALQVTAGEGGLFPEEVAAQVARVPGIEIAVPVVSAAAFTTDGSGEMLTVHGIDVTSDDAVRVYQARTPAGEVVEDPLVFLSQPDSILMTREFATRGHIVEGDSIELETPTGRQRFTVRGLIEAEGVGRIYGGNVVVMDLMAAEQAFTRPGLINRVDVVVGRGEDVGAVQRELAAALPEGLQVTAPAQRKVDLHRVMRSVQVVLQGVGLLALVAAFLIVFNRLSAAFEGRLWQAGVMRAMGLRPATVCKELLSESLLLGAGGVLLGLPLGVALAQGMLPIIATTTAIGAKLTVPSAQLEVRPSALVTAALLGLGATLLAAALPAWRTATAETATVLRARGRELGPGTDRAWAARWLVAVGAAFAVGIELWSRSATSGLVASLLILVSAALCARPLVGILRWHPLKMLLWRVGPTERLAAAALERSPRRTSLTMATLGVGFAVVTWLWVLATSVERSVVNVMPGIFRADLVVGSLLVGSGYVEAPVDETLVDELAGIPGVAAVVGEQVSDWQYADGPIAINAFDARFFADPLFERWPLVGSELPRLWESVGRGELVIVSSNFAHNLGVEVGDLLQLETPSGPLAVRVGGVTHDFLSPRGSILMSRELYRQYWRDTRVTHALIRVAPGTDLPKLRSAIAEHAGARYSLRILSVRELVDWFAAQARRAFSAIYALGSMVLLVVAIGVADTVAAGVLERRPELAAMSAFGVRRPKIGRMILAEALLLALGGVALALLGGLALGVLWVKITFPDLVGWVLELHIPTAYCLLTALLAVAVCLAAAILPAYQSMRSEPAEALRYE